MMDELDRQIADVMKRRAVPEASGDLAGRAKAKAEAREVRVRRGWERSDRWMRVGRVLQGLVVLIAGVLVAGALYWAWGEWVMGQGGAEMVEAGEGAEEMVGQADIVLASVVMVICGVFAAVVGGMIWERRGVIRKAG